ncbi:T9SS type A sorting domain-containing protein [Formosa sp. Hel1_31_208]|uniref:T9SS type A sorting domain-containing protein n=1 Tax=Formosa sp. Hel1_31_208 TaxID=1798225 RepID=UPI000B87AAFC|nr:T9SS type A sorting domain-containing protein [Formosa sp. Hel1_31_208]
MTNGVVVTNNSSLSQIFTNYNVRYYTEIFPSTYYELICDCDAELLKQELDNLTSVVQFTEFVSYVFLLSTDDPQLINAEVYPNPFKNVINLKASVPLSAILLYDVLGKQVVSAKNVSTFEADAINLKTGVYMLRLIDINGKSITKKLVKQ